MGGREAEGGGTRDAELEESEGIARPTSNAGSNAGVAVGQLSARMHGRDREGRVAELHVAAIGAPPRQKCLRLKPNYYSRLPRPYSLPYRRTGGRLGSIVPIRPASP